MKIVEIYKILDAIAPFDSQESWDNSGLLVGSLEGEFERIYLSLDLSREILENALPNSLFITHHPLIFKGLKSLNFSCYPSNLIQKMIEKNISLISVHTNADLAFLNEHFTREILGFEPSERDEFLMYCEVKFGFDELACFLKEKLGVKTLRAVRAKDEISRICVCTGSGADLIGQVRADAFLTGDLKYHQALEAKENGINLFDIGHFESERYFGAALAKYLQNLEIEVIIADFKNPFTHC